MREGHNKITKYYSIFENSFYVYVYILDINKCNKNVNYNLITASASYLVGKGIPVE